MPDTQERSSLCIPIECVNSRTTKNIWQVNLAPTQTLQTNTKSSTSTKLFESELPKPMTSSSWTFHNSKTSSRTILSTQKPQNQMMPNNPNSLQTVTPRSVADGMQVDALPACAIINMCAPNAKGNTK